jgi:hypothetical protein
MSPKQLLPLFCLLFLPNLSQAAWWETSVYRALFALQPFKTEQSRNYENASPNQVTLLNLNTNTNRWYLLRLADGRGKDSFFNLQPMRNGLQLNLDEAAPRLLISQDGEEVHKCDIAQEIILAYAQRKQTRLAYLPVCQDLLYITIKQNGETTRVEREEGWLQRFASKIQAPTASEEAEGEEHTPPRARIASQYLNTGMTGNKLGLKLRHPGQKLLAGDWYPLAAGQGVFASLINPGMVSPEILGSWRDRANSLDGSENSATAFLLAMDLDLYSLEWGHGTNLPEVGWSKRATLVKRDNPYGPDGINSLAPLIPLGHIPPGQWHRLLGSISGGFQLRHSAFKAGELAKTNKGHHYGFMENGVLMMSPSPNLITLISYQDGRTDLRVWREEDNAELDQIKHLRQNGVPFIEPGEDGRGIPGKLVKFWVPGNWSGSADVKLRTPRGAACLIEDNDKRFMVYGYFSSATPSGIARTFQAYGCKTAIQLDMNSPGQAYASLSRPLDSGKFQIEHLMTDMFTGDTQGAPRYVIKPDYKDFFYILRR